MNMLLYVWRLLEPHNSQNTSPISAELDAIRKLDAIYYAIRKLDAICPGTDILICLASLRATQLTDLIEFHQ